jgi:hypothetical protein
MWPSASLTSIGRRFGNADTEALLLPSLITVASQPITQAKIRYLKYTVGEERLLDLVGQGKLLDEIAEEVDPAGLEGINSNIITRFLSGLTLDKTGPEPDTEVEAKQRRVRYKEARRLWAEALVEQAGGKLMREGNDRMANLRRAQADWALKVAGVHNEDYKPPSAQVNIGVQVGVGQLHLDALRLRRVEIADAEVLAVEEPEQAALPAAGALAFCKTDSVEQSHAAGSVP